MRPLLFLAALFFCTSAFAKDVPTKTITFDFKKGPLGWDADFSDYPAGQEAAFNFQKKIARLPRGIKGHPTAWFLSSNNLNADLCMYLRRQITNLVPDMTYNVHFKVTFASNASARAAGAGSAPGSVAVKAGVTHVEPVTTNGQLNIDKGSQSRWGADAYVLGNIGVNSPAGSSRYRLKELDQRITTIPFVFTTDGTGTAWLFVATDSGFEGNTSLYFARIVVDFVPYH